MKQRLTYKAKPICVNKETSIRAGVCDCCKAVGRTELHHWKYAYTLKEVRQKPELALDHTSCLCFRCHQLANALRKLFEADCRTIERLYALYRKEINHSY